MIYIPILRSALADFVNNVWNNHRIRKQPKRPYLVSGIPYVLYHYPERTGGVDCGLPIPKDSPTIARLQGELIGLDLNEYLPPATFQ
jgi:hypothetical protein